MSKTIDLTGMKFGRLTVIRKSDKKASKAYWVCECECGNVREVASSSLRNGKSKSCGCLKKENMVGLSPTNFVDLTGQKFGRLTVIERAKNTKQGKVAWLCKCECGNEKIIAGEKLKMGATVSCGCYNMEIKKQQVLDLTGQKFGRLTVIERAGYIGKKVAWLCKCECGNEKIIAASNLKQGQISCGCYNHSGVNHPNWQGGITKISEHFRHLSIIRQWRKDTYIRENSKCQLTGKEVHGGNSDVHHLKGFNVIVKEAHDLHNIQIKEIVADYTDEELKLLEDYVSSCHEDTTNAVLLSKEVHDLFHHEYGYGENTLEQYEEFKQRYLNGEFDNSDSKIA